MAQVCQALQVSIWEVIEAAATKPFGYMPFYPGPGIGGHCINSDSTYLAWKARLHGSEPRLIELAQQINSEMPALVVERTAQILNDKHKSIKGSRILVLGAAYKKNVSDVRESPSLEIIERILNLGGKVRYHDPFVPSVGVREQTLRSVRITPSLLSSQDIILILTDHDAVDYKSVANSGTPIFDTRNVLKGYLKKRSNVIKL